MLFSQIVYADRHDFDDGRDNFRDDRFDDLEDEDYYDKLERKRDHLAHIETF